MKTPIDLLILDRIVKVVRTEKLSISNFKIKGKPEDISNRIPAPLNKIIDLNKGPDQIIKGKKSNTYTP